MARTSNPIWSIVDGIKDQRAASKRPQVPMLGPDVRLDGRTVLVTGANGGLGKGIALDLARRGARLLMACRSGIPEAGHEVRRATGNNDVEMLPVDLADLEKVHALCDALVERGITLDAVVCNAAVMPAKPRATAQGLELMFGVNYFANVVLLSRLLADGVIPNQTFRAGAEPPATRPRIVIVSSEAHRTAAPVNFERFAEYVQYNSVTGMKQYGHTKLLLVTLAQELARRLDGDVAVHSMCPGAVNTGLAREAPRLFKPLLGAVMGRFFASPEEAARPVVRLVADPAIEGQTGLYMHMKAERTPVAHAVDPGSGKRLWTASLNLQNIVDPRGWSWPEQQEATP